MSDLISRNALIQHAYSAVVDGVEKDIIDLSDVDNAPTVYPICEDKACKYRAEERPKGEWIVTAEDNDGVHRICCPFCFYEKGSNNTDPIIVTFTNFPKFCENCGADLRGDKE